ncbi:hypothetical protein H2248_003043 [Termitomyces sp. 'cryptogamus']|nr:hypothetical protein H2248_003043 [Termitomyces sp. 'cryptogamus']
MNLLKIFQSTLRRATSPYHSRVGVPRLFPITGFRNIPPSEVVKDSEERWDWYTPQSFYPVRIGDVIHSNYQVLYKVGFGTTSTLWICRDLRSNAYVCMKSMVCDYSSVGREIEAYRLISEAVETSRLVGQRFVRQALDHFEIQIEDRRYHFLIHEPLGLTVHMLAHDVEDGVLSILSVKFFARDVLRALEFIHSAHIVHADVQAKNVILRIADESVLKAGEESEIEHPSARKITEQAAVFETRPYTGSVKPWIGDSVVLCDFGEARTGKEFYTGLAQPPPLRAPEVSFGIPWGTPVDIWSFGCTIWNLMFSNHLFPRDNSRPTNDKPTVDKDQLAWMIALLGPPPRQLIDEADSHVLEFFNEDGSPKVEIPNETLESFLASSLDRVGKTMTPQESEIFLAFIRRTVTWTQATRASASELLHDPWVTSSQ